MRTIEETNIPEWASGDLRKYVLKAGIYILIAIVLLAMVFPVAWLAITSIQPFQGIFAFPPELSVEEITFERYVELWTTTDIPLFLRNSIMVAISTMIVTTIVSVMGAYSLTRFRYPRRKQIANSILLTYMVPPIMLIVPLFVTFKFMNLTNTLIAVAIAHITYSLPFSLWFMRAFFESIPTTYEEAAMCEGASRLQAVWYTVLPLSIPGIATIAIFSFTVSWNDYLFAFIFLTENSKFTLPVAAAQAASAAGTPWTTIVTIAMIIAIPPLIAIALILNHLLEGFGVAG